MSTLKYAMLIAMMATFFSCQENEAELMVLEDEASNNVQVCGRPNCAAKVTVISAEFIRWRIIN
ncbi:MAG: hypothetical protein AAGA66_12025 [Bacteroidota bacterium]